MNKVETGTDPNDKQGFAYDIAEYHDFEICREPWDFYYDETENCRSVSYGGRAIKDAQAIERDFILGGIAVTAPGAATGLAEGCARLPSPGGEVKCRPVLSGSSDFWRVLRRREVSAFLELLDRPGVVVHYHAQDNLYYSIVDIVDSVIWLPGHEHMAVWHRELKNALYLCASQDRVGFLNDLATFGYPNIAPSEIGSFCRYIADLLESMLGQSSPFEESQNGFFVETLRQMMKTASKADRLALLEGNKEDALVEGFSAHYQTTCMLLPEATHHFDDEMHISMTLVESLGNFEFVDSKLEPFVQLSDVWVGLLSRLFRFLDEWAEDPRPLLTGSTAGRQLENLRTIKRLIDRADSTHRSLLSNINADEVIWRREHTLDLLCSD